jgi:hypothetical protein
MEMVSKRLKLRLLFILTLSACCGREEPPQSAIEGYHEQFRKDAMDCGLQLPPRSSGYIGVEVEPKDEDDIRVLGYCWYVNPVTYWGWYVGLSKDDLVDPDGEHHEMLQAVVYHELGHCLLGLPHADQEERSLMKPYMGSEDVEDFEYRRFEVFLRKGADPTQCPPRGN